MLNHLDEFRYDYTCVAIGQSLIVHADSFDWLRRASENTVHAIVTDPPYGVKEYHEEQILKRQSGNGGVWRIPPSFDGHKRSPLPRFTALNRHERIALTAFFADWGRLALRVLRPGGHLFIASNAYLSQLVFSALSETGFEFRGEIVRLVRTFRGGDRPKNAEQEFPDVCSLPRSAYEPWGLFRKPLPPRMKVSDCLREFQTGGVRRLPDGKPFADVIPSERTPQAERQIANHPSLKPQSFMRQIVHSSLPLGVGVVIDPFMGAGSTIAAAEALGISSVGIEVYDDYFEIARKSIPALASLGVKSAPTEQLSMLL